MASPNFFSVRTATGQEYAVTDPKTIGRDASNGIALDDAAASRLHATLWVEGNTLYIRDEKSANGIAVNNKLIPSGQPVALHNGDRIRIGKTELTVSAVEATAGGTILLPPQPKKNNRRGLWLACAGLAVVGLVILCAVPVIGYYAFGWSVPQLAGVLPGGGGPVAGTQVNANAIHLSTPAPLLGQKEYVDQNASLVRTVSSLNGAELRFVKHAAQANPSSKLTLFGVLAFPNFVTQSTLDGELTDVAVNALQVCTTADGLGKTMAAQDGASEKAGQAASQYVSIAQLTCALVIDSQNLRSGLASGAVKPAAAAATIAEYGARLWSPSVVDETGIGNPFIGFVSNPSSVPTAKQTDLAAVNTLAGSATTLAVVAAADTQQSKTLTLDALTLSAPYVDFNDAAQVAPLLTADGQRANGPAAMQVAKAIIQTSNPTSAGATPLQGNQVVATFAGATTVSASASPSAASPNTLLVFPKGKAIVLTEDSDDKAVTTLLGIDDNGTPSEEGQTSIEDTNAFVTLSIGKVVIENVTKTTGSFEAQAVITFEISWTTRLAAPNFEISCNNQLAATATSGTGSKSVTVTTTLILYPGAVDLYCTAGNIARSFGSVSARVLVGDAEGATQRANQVETDSAVLNMTFTADAMQEAQTQVATTTGIAQTQQSVNQTEDALSTEVIGTQTAEFVATITQIARQTALAPTPGPTETPLPTATFVPVLVDTFSHPGNAFSVTSHIMTTPGHLYRVCLGGTVNLTTGPVGPSDIDHVNGIRVPASGCVVVEGDGKVIVVTCGTGEAAEEPGGFDIQVFDLGPS